MGRQPPSGYVAKERAPVSRSRRTLAVAGFLLAVCCLAHVGGPRRGFVEDELIFIAERERLFGDWGRAPGLLLNPWPFFAGARFVYYRPLPLLSFLAEHQVWGLTLDGARWRNIVLHAANSALVYVIAEALLHRGAAALVVALLFAVHPLRAEAIHYLSARIEVLHAFFWLLATLLFLQSRKQTGARGVRRHLGALACFAAALMSKELALAFPLAILAVDLWATERARERLGWLLARHAPFWVLAAAYVALRMSVLVPFRAPSCEPSVQFAGLAQGLRVLALYLQVLWLPVHLYQEYTLALVGPWKLAWVGATAAAIGAFLGVGLSRCGLRLLAMAGAWFVATLLPVYPTLASPATVNADRFLYLPGVAMALILGLALTELTWHNAQARRRSVMLALGLALGCSILASRQGRFWQDAVAHHAKQFLGAPQDVLIENRLNAALLMSGRPGLAARRLERLVARQPDDLRARQTLGAAWVEAGQFEKAIPHLERVLQADPQEDRARQALSAAHSMRRQAERRNDESRRTR